MKFEDTDLLRHPTVEKAYNVMRTFFQDGDDFAREAVRPGELISKHSANPDPDAIAASILMNGMVISLDPDQFEASVSPKAVEYLKKFYELDIDNPKATSAGEQQILLAQSMVGLQGVQAKLDSGEVNHFLEFSDMRQILDANERVLKSVATHKTEEHALLAQAQAQLVHAQQTLADIVDKHEKKIAFENTGLPDHPVVRKTYEEMKKWALDGDPLGGYAVTNAAIARVVVETGASTDPEVISAALLNQYSVIRPGFKKPSDFSERIGDLYAQTSPWANMGKKEMPKDPEALIIRNAAITHFLESSVQSYTEWKASARFDASSAVVALENMEDLKKRVEAAAALEEHPALKTRMEKAVNEADKLMTAPENVNIRKPGAPKIDRGW